MFRGKRSSRMEAEADESLERLQTLTDRLEEATSALEALVAQIRADDEERKQGD